jgi:hypothetical protein
VAADSVESVPANEIEQLLARAANSDRARTRALGDRLRQTLVELRSHLDIESKQAQAQARVVELRDQLAAAEAQLRQIRIGTNSTTSAGAGSEDAPINSREVRAWAQANDVDCNTHGRVPADVVAAWRAATGRAA